MVGTGRNLKKGYPLGMLQTSHEQYTTGSKDFPSQAHPCPIANRRRKVLSFKTKYQKDTLERSLLETHTLAKLQYRATIHPSGFDPLPITLGTTQTAITYTAPPPYAILKRSTLLNKNPKKKNQICLLFASNLLTSL